MKQITVHEAHQIALFDRSIRSVVAAEPVPSWPIPLREAGEQRKFQVFYYSLYGPPPALVFTIYPPNYVAEIAADGTTTAPFRVTPEQIGLHGAVRGEPFATHAWPAEWTWQIGDAKRIALDEVFEAMVRLWVRDVKASSPAASDVVAQFRQQFLELVEPPLLPCYRALGRPFFAWAGI